jgi:hypothetical protein
MEGGNKNVVGAVSGGERRETRCRRPAAPPLLVKICFPSLPPPPVGGKQVFFFRRRERRKRFAIGAAKKKKETNARVAKSFNSSFFSVSDTISRDLKLKASDGNRRRSVSEGRTLNSSERFGKKSGTIFLRDFFSDSISILTLSRALASFCRYQRTPRAHRTGSGKTKQSMRDLRERGRLRASLFRCSPRFTLSEERKEKKKRKEEGDEKSEGERKVFFFLHCFSLSLSFFSLSFSLLATASSSFSRLLLSNVLFSRVNQRRTVLSLITLSLKLKGQKSRA